MSSAMLMGCSNNVNEENIIGSNFEATSSVDSSEFVPVVKLKLEDESSLPSKIKGYKFLEVSKMYDEELGYHGINLISDAAKNIRLETAESIKALLGDNIELIVSQIVDENGEEVDDPSRCYLKGYENAEDGSISLWLRDKVDGDIYLVPMLGIEFKSESKNLSDSLKSILGMEDKIEIVLDNLLEKEEAKEVLRFIKEEISRINSGKESSLELIEIYEDKKIEKREVEIIINEDISLLLSVVYNMRDDSMYNATLSVMSNSVTRDYINNLLNDNE